MHGDPAGFATPIMEGQAPLTGPELEQLLGDFLNDNQIPMEDELALGGLVFTIRSVDHGETERVFRELRHDDIYTREMAMQKMLLSLATTKLNGRPIQDASALIRFFGNAPPALVTRLYDVFVALRRGQELRIASLAAEIKKEQASPLSVPSGG